MTFVYRRHDWHGCHRAFDRSRSQCPGLAQIDCAKVCRIYTAK